MSPIYYGRLGWAQIGPTNQHQLCKCYWNIPQKWWNDFRKTYQRHFDTNSSIRNDFFVKKNYKILTPKLDVFTFSSEILYLPFGQQTNCNPKYRSPSAHVERGANEWSLKFISAQVLSFFCENTYRRNQGIFSKIQNKRVPNLWASVRHPAASLQVSFSMRWVCLNEHIGGTARAGGPVGISSSTSAVVSHSTARTEVVGAAVVPVVVVVKVVVVVEIVVVVLESNSSPRLISKSWNFHSF